MKTNTLSRRNALKAGAALAAGAALPRLASAADGVGWVYDATDGSVTAAIPSAKATELGTQLPTADISTF